MKAVIVARVVDVVENEFLNKETNEKVEYLTVSVIDEDAFLDKERIFTMTASRDLLGGRKPEEMIGKTFQFKGVLSNFWNSRIEKTEFKFKPVSLQSVEK